MKISYHFLKAVWFIFHIYICYVPENDFWSWVWDGSGFIFLQMDVLSTIYWKDRPCPSQRRWLHHKPRVRIREDPLFGSLSCSLSCLLMLVPVPCGLYKFVIDYRFIVSLISGKRSSHLFFYFFKRSWPFSVICIFNIYILHSVCEVLPKHPAGILIRTALIPLRRPYILTVLSLSIHKIIHPFLHVGLL